MSAYRFYDDETRIFNTSSRIIVDKDQALRVISRLCRKFKIKRKSIRIIFSSRLDAGRGGHANSYRMVVCTHPSIKLLIHEFGHIMQARHHPLYRGNFNYYGHPECHNAHDHWFMSLLMKIHAYAGEHNYWVEKSRMTQPKDKAEKQVCPACGELYNITVRCNFNESVTGECVVLCPDCCVEYEFLKQQRLSPGTISTKQYVELYEWIRVTRAIHESRRPGGAEVK